MGRRAAIGGILDNGRLFVALSILAPCLLIVANVVLLPRMAALAGGLPILDMRRWYSERGAYQLLEALGAHGRSMYLALLWTFDLIAPVVFGLFLASAIGRTRLRRLAWLPLVATTFDYAENVAITALLVRYPVHAPGLVRVSAVFTLLKSIFYLAGIVLAVVGLLWRRGNPAGQ